MELTRRSLMVSAGKLTSAALIASPLVADTSQTSAARKIKVIVCGGHPGDPEYGCGATAALLTALGHQVVLLYLNDGAWPPTPASIRSAEAAKACEILRELRFDAVGRIFVVVERTIGDGIADRGNPLRPGECGLLDRQRRRRGQ